MSFRSASPAVAIYGATGVTGRGVCHELHAAGVTVAICGRDSDKLEALRRDVSAATIGIAPIEDAAALAAAFAGARVVINCSGPAAITGERALVAALKAGAHYVDIAGDQAYLHAMMVRHDSTARRCERVCMPGVGLQCAIGDLAAAWAAESICGITSTEVLRSSAPERLAEDRPFDDIAVSYLFDDLVLSPASQRAVFEALHAPGVAWRRDRWEPVAPAAQRRRIHAGPEMGGERDVLSFPGGDVITIPRHIASRSVQTFVSTTRTAAATTALRLFARALPVMPKRISAVLAPYVPAREEYGKTRVEIVASAQRGPSATQVSVRGTDVYRISAVVAAWIARHLLARGSGPVGMRAASEIFHPQPALQALAQVAGLTIETEIG